MAEKTIIQESRGKDQGTEINELTMTLEFATITRALRGKGVVAELKRGFEMKRQGEGRHAVKENEIRNH